MRKYLWFALRSQILRIPTECDALIWELLVGARSLKMGIIKKVRLEVNELHSINILSESQDKGNKKGKAFFSEKVNTTNSGYFS